MSRDFRKLRVFQIADQLLLRVYRQSSGFPAAERFSLQAQLRRAALSTSPTETRYLADVLRRLGYIAEDEAADIVDQYTALSAQLQALLASLDSVSISRSRP